MEKFHPSDNAQTHEAQERNEPHEPKKSSGEEVFREVAEIAEDAEIELSSFQEEFFSHIDPNPRIDFFKKVPDKRGRVDVTGLSVTLERNAQNRGYRYDREYQRLAHQAVLEGIMEQSRDWNDFLEHIRAEDEKWRDNCTSFLIKKFDAERLATTKFKTLADVKQHYRLSDSEKTAAINKFAIERGIMSKEEVDGYWDAKRKCSYDMAGSEVYKEHKAEITAMNKEAPGTEFLVKKTFEDRFRDIYKAIAFEEVERRRQNPSEENDYIIKEITRDANHSKDLGKLFAGRTSEEAISEARQKIRDQILGRVNDGVEDIFREYEANCRTFLGSMLPKRAIAKKRWEEQQKAAFQKDMNKYLKEKAEPEKRARHVVYGIKQKIAEYARGDEEPMAEIFILPTGIVTRMPSGELGAFALSPDDPGLLEKFTKYQIDAWGYAWGKYDTSGLDESSIKFRKKLNERFISTTEKSPEVLSERERETYRLMNQYGIPIPRPIDSEEGSMKASPAFYLEELSEVLPVVGDFIQSISTKQNPWKKVTPSEVKDEIMEFFGGVASRSKPHLVSDDLELNISAVADIARAKKLIFGVVMSSVVVELAQSLYVNLDKSSLKEFVTLTKDKLDVPEEIFSRATKYRVPNPNNRRALMCRIVFASNFKKFLEGRASPEFNAFFEKIHQKYKTPQLSDGRKIYWEE